WPGPAAGDQLAPGPEPASAKAPGTEGGPSAPGGPETAKTRARGRSVWQRSLSAWRAAGLEWQPAPGPEWQRSPGPGGQRSPGAGWQRLAGPERQPAPGPEGPRVAGADLTGTDPGHTEPVPGLSAPGGPLDVAAPRGPPDPPGPTGGHPPGWRRAGPVPAARGGRKPRRGRRAVVVAAVACPVLLALAAAGIVIAGPRSAGPVRGRPGLLVAYPAARLADAQFAAAGGAPPDGGPPPLTASAAARRAGGGVGWQATLPFARPLVLMSPDGGRTWQSALLHAPRGGATAGAAPVMVAGGGGRWLALGPSAAWTSTDGRSWRLGPGIAPLVSGD